MTGERAILWLAVSTEQQADDERESLPDQEKQLRAKAAEHEHTVIDVIRVPGFSRRYLTYAEFADAAAQDEHSDALRMWQHWRRRDFDVLYLRDGSRMGREQSIFAEFTIRTIQAGARIFDMTWGMVDEVNHRTYAMVGGYQAAQEVDNLVKRSKIGKQGKVERGMIATGRMPMTHMPVRNAKGKAERIVVKPEMRRLLDDLATLLIEGVAWRKIEPELYRRFGHVNPRTGKPFARGVLYRILQSPVFWGHAAQRFDMKGFKSPSGTWMFDKSVAPPSHVQITYDSPYIEAGYTGEVAEKVMAELRRRVEMRGKMQPSVTKPFAGIFVCAECGRYLVHHTIKQGYYKRKYTYKGKEYNDVLHKKEDYHASFCPNVYYDGKTCTNRKQLSHKRAMEYFNAMLIPMLQHNDTTRFFQEQQPEDSSVLLRTDILSVEEQMKRLIREQASAPDAAQDFYREQVAALAERLQILRTNLATVERKVEASNQEKQSGAVALERIREVGLEQFWQLPTREINQLLHMIVGRNRFMVKEGQIVGYVPQHGRKRNRFL